MRLADFFVCTAIIDGGPALARAELIGRLVTVLAQAGHVPRAEEPAILDAVLRRERLGSTGIGKGLAVPHARHHAVRRPLGVLAICRPPVEFDAIDGEPVDLVALCLFPPDRYGQSLGEASLWSEGPFRRLADEAFCRRLRRAGSAREIEEIVQEDGMTRREWSTCKGPAAMLRLLRERALVSERKARLFAAACCRRHGDILPEEGRRAVEAVERHADGLAGQEELDAARRDFTAVIGEASGPASFARVAVLYLVAEVWHDPLRYAMDISSWAAQAGVDQAAELAAQAGMVRCLFGSPPFGPVAIESGWLPADVPALALAAYDGRGLEGTLDPARLSVLADSLEEAGANAGLADHLRGGQHWRGCFVIDVLTGREREG